MSLYSGGPVSQQFREVLFGEAGSVGIHAEDLQDAFQFGIAEEIDFKGALALGVAQMDFGAEPLAELGSQGGRRERPCRVAKAGWPW